jgi:hypothetical protein
MPRNLKETVCSWIRLLCSFIKLYEYVQYTWHVILSLLFLFNYLIGLNHRVSRVLSFSQVVVIGTPPIPHLKASVLPPPPPSLVLGGRGSLTGERGDGRVPIPTRGHTLWYSLYVHMYFVVLPVEEPDQVGLAVAVRATHPPLHLVYGGRELLRVCLARTENGQEQTWNFYYYYVPLWVLLAFQVTELLEQRFKNLNRLIWLHVFRSIHVVGACE